MQKDTEELLMSAQQALDELFAEGLIPIKLSVRAIESLGYGEYIVRFHNSRLPSVDVSRPENQPFKELVRNAVLDRVSRLTGPLKGV